MATSLADIKWLLITALLLVSPNYPWYFLVLTPFVALQRRRAGVGVEHRRAVAAGGSELGLLRSAAHRKSVLYGAFVLACAYPLWRLWQARQMTPATPRQTNGKQPV